VLNPKVVFLENVRNLKTHDKGKTYQVIYNSLRNRGYFIKSAVLNTMKFGNLPQNRERIYIICFKDESLCTKFCFPNPIHLTVSFRDLLEPSELIDEKYYYHPNQRYYQILSQHVHSFDTVYQLRRVYVRKNQKGVCPTLTANMGGGGHNVPIIRDSRGIRKLTPRECARLQGFPDNYQFPVSDTQAYKQIGNSVSIPVIKRIAEEIRRVLEYQQQLNNNLQTQFNLN
jgi:DNA (cytosine-5)-methyltransferase 1